MVFSFTTGLRRVAVLALLCACQTYEPRPLDPVDILETVKTRRREASREDVATLERATTLMREHSPRLRDARAVLAGARALADTPTPLPNPSVDVAGLYLDGADVLGSDRRGLDASLGWSILLGGRRKLTDELHAIEAEAAQIEVVSVQREEYLALRREFAGLGLAGRGVAANLDLEETVKASLDIVRRLVEAAQATALDVRELELEVYESEGAVLSARERETEARASLAARTGVGAEAFPGAGLPPLPAEVPPPEALEEILLRDHPELARLRAAYRVAEKELRLEIARQYPALGLGFSYEREEGVNKYGLGLSVEIPVFDRNQPGIASARARREEIRTRFESQVQRGLQAVEAARARLAARRARLSLMKEKLEPAATEALELARRSLSSGAADALRFLTVLRVERNVRIELLEAEQDVYAAWSDLEDACGAPLLRFPEEPGDAEGGEEQ